ncbi:MAG: hybrid sensor histidine kinase/response regulator [Kofleriaceae bacterium]
MTEAIKVLLVDDIADNLIALEALLRRDGVELLKAESGADALELLLAHEFSLALLDVQMPEMDGFELAELMRGATRTKHVPIIFVTAGNRDPQRVFKGYETGAVDFLYKPIDPHILRTKVEVFLELALRRSELEQALRLNEIFVGILGHDLRNPLGAVISGIEVLRDEVTDAMHKKILDRMSASTQRMTDMIEQMLDLTRARLGQGIEFSHKQLLVDMSELVQRTLDELRASHPEREIRFEGGDCATIGDPDRLLQMLSNLVGNAIVHGTPNTPVTASIEECNARVVIEIRNSGAVPPALLPTLFEPFRGKRSNPNGLGLGLFIARQIARGHGGDIDVMSSETTGTCVRVTLPHVREAIRTAS